MSILLLKEFRLASDVLLGACVLLAASFPLALAGVAMQGVRPFPWISAVAGACILNQYTMVLTGALLGAAVFAREREEGNIHFLAMLPLSRVRQFAAKAAASSALWFALWAINALILIAITFAMAGGPGSLAPFIARMVAVAILSFAALGFGAFAGSRIDSVTGAAFSGAGALLAAAVLRSLWTASAGSEFFAMPFLFLLGLLGAAGMAGSARAFTRTSVSRRRALPRAGAHGSPKPFVVKGTAGALIWKDARLMRVSIGAGLLLVLLPFVAAGGNALVAGGAAPGFRTASLLAMALGWIVLPLWSAGSLAGEWEAASHQFLACLPVSTRRIVAAKFAVAAVPAFLVVLAAVAGFSLSQRSIPGEPVVPGAMSWDEFNASHFLGGATAYACALPVTFAVAWYFAARLRRKIVAIVLGVVSGPLAMAAWAVTSAPEGFMMQNFFPIQAVAIHGAALAGLSGLLVVLGARQVVRDGL